MDPTLIWTGNLRDGEILRQISVSDLTEGGKRLVRVISLGSEGGSDHVAIHEFPVGDASDDKTERGGFFLVKMPGINGRLAASHDHLPPVWQDLDGELFEGRVALELVHAFF